jgi:hypothetical protein
MVTRGAGQIGESKKVVLPCPSILDGIAYWLCSQGTKDAASIRVRDNQRRSRARRKQYIHELEESLMQLQKQGIRATEEVQLAGRRAAEENKGLRSLLKLHGLTDADINGYLYPKSDQTSSASCDTYSHISTPGPISTRRQTQSCSGIAKDTQNYSAEEYPHSQHDLIQRHTSHPFSENESLASNVASVPNRDIHETAPSRRTPEARTDPTTVHSVDDSVRLEISMTASRSNDSGDRGQMTSCDTAINIIAGMRGYRDMNDARQELGCTSPNCVVKNLTLFDLLDR